MKFVTVERKWKNEESEILGKIFEKRGEEEPKLLQKNSPLKFTVNPAYIL